MLLSVPEITDTTSNGGIGWQFSFTAYNINITIGHDFVVYIIRLSGKALGKFPTDKGQTKTTCN